MKRHVLPMLVALSLAALLSGCGKNTTAPTAVTPLDEAPPAAPTALTHVPDPGLPGGRLQWDPSPSPNVSNYEIYRYEPSPDRAEAYVQVGQTNAATTSFPLPALEASTTLYYRLKAVSPTGLKSQWSETASIRLSTDSDPEHNPDEPGIQVPVKR